MENNFTKKELKEIFEKEIKYEEATMFMHCQNCLSKFIGSELHSYKSAHEAMEYEVSSAPFVYPDGTKASVLVVWCKKCGKEVWDSRHLQPWL